MAWSTTPGSVRRGFSLVELMTVITIVAILAGLSLSGLAAARLRARIDKTKMTIQKLHEIVMPQYEAYLRRRVPLTGAPTSRQQLAQDNLQWIRRLMVRELPDTWSDIPPNPAAVAALPVGYRTGPVYAYAAARSAGPSSANEAAECLYLIASRGRGDPEAMEQFRVEEIGDVDADGAPEFLDAWQRPITFMRWAPGLGGSIVQKADPVAYHDPFDPQRVDSAGFALVPLIVSSGPDGVLGLNASPTSGWSPAASLLSIVGLMTPAPGSTIGSGVDASDNITNHDLVSK